MPIEGIDFEPLEAERAPLNIKVLGVGGAGNNALDQMLDMEIKGVELFALNTDRKALENCRCENKIQLGAELTGGWGAGADPSIGRKAAEVSQDQLLDILHDTQLLFLIAGLGKGTGTGATPFIAQLAREQDLLTLAMVILPFAFEGERRQQLAQEGLAELHQVCQSVIVVSNEKTRQLDLHHLSFSHALKEVNLIFCQAIKSIAEVITHRWQISVDFGDLRTVLSLPGKAVMGIGTGKGESRSLEALHKASSHKLLDRVSLRGARGVLLCFGGDESLTLDEITMAADEVHRQLSPNAQLIFGCSLDDSLRDEVRVLVIATGLSETEPEEEDENAAAVSAKKAGPKEKQPLSDESEKAIHDFSIPTLLREKKQQRPKP